MKIPKYDPKAPITKKHLLQACAWARGVAVAGLRHAMYSQTLYCEREAVCGTAYCIHGAAHLLARGVETFTGPRAGDYADCSPLVRVLLAMGASEVSPDLIEAACDAPNTAVKAAKWLAAYCGNDYHKLSMLLGGQWPGGRPLVQYRGVASLLFRQAERPEWLVRRNKYAET